MAVGMEKSNAIGDLGSTLRNMNDGMCGWREEIEDEAKDQASGLGYDWENHVLFT